MPVRAIRARCKSTPTSGRRSWKGPTELVSEVMSRNGLVPDDVISVIFTVTPDLTTEFPALAARKIGFQDVPLMCATEIPVPGALPRVVRLWRTWTRSARAARSSTSTCAARPRSGWTSPNRPA